ncbi:MAG: hypothetical protein IPO92_10435 [Saprospiraceae bacterium]|nr:hypothetical protein [Saprospiraceae bacterium]
MQSVPTFFQTIPKDLVFDSMSNHWIYFIPASVHRWEYNLTGKIDAKLAFIKWTGFLSFLVFGLSHIPSLGMQINPICIILCYIHIFYGFVIIILKNYLYYSSIQSTNFSKTVALLFRNILIILLLLFFAKKYWNSNYNTLQYLNEYAFDKNETIDIDTFIKNYDRMDTSHTKVNYYIASWGGGLRATYLDLLMLDKSNGKLKIPFE